MKDIEQYVKEITMNLPDEESRKLREKINRHFQDHVNELLANGYSEEEAIRQAIESFGNQGKLNRELKKGVFPFYKPIRFVWNVIMVTAFLCLASYSIMEYDHPESENSLPLYSVLMAMFLVTLIAGAAEAIYEAVNSQFKFRWLSNPWLFYLVPAILFGGIQTLHLLKNVEQYQNSLLWVDLYTLPIAAFAYIISRQLFTLLFVRNKKSKRNAVYEN